MTNLVPLHFESSDIRMVMQAGEPWWVLADLAPALDLANPSKLASRLEPYQKADIPIRDTSSGQIRQMICVNEAGIYALTLNSRKEAAKVFARWLFTQVLPSIRKFGAYPPPKSLGTSDLPALEPVQAPEGTTPTQRFLEEVDRMAAVMRTTPEKVLKVLTSAQTVRMMRLHGEGLSSILKKADKVEAMGSAGFDLKYILRGERTMTRDERTLVSQLRRIDPGERVAAFHRFAGLLPALAAPSADEIEDA